MSQIDLSNYYGVLQSFDQHVEGAAVLANSAIQEISRASGRPAANDIDHVVICGMGGSAIAGDLVRSLLIDQLDVPLLVCRDYSVPHFVGPRSLVVVSSYSGQTEETLAALTDARKRGARLITMATGGPVADIGRAQAFCHVTLPAGFQPRQSVAYSLISMYAILRYVFFGETDVQYAGRVAESIRRCRKDLTGDFLVRTAEALSVQPVVAYASDRHASIAVRFKGQVCENAKLLAFANVIPEMNHNEIVGWDMYTGTDAHGPGIVLFRDDSDHPQVRRRFDVVKNLLQRHSHVVEYWMTGESLIEKYVGAIHWGDWLSYHMAIARKVDPTPVDSITRLKRELGTDSSGM